MNNSSGKRGEMSRRKFVAGLTMAGAALPFIGTNIPAGENQVVRNGRIHVFTKPMQWLSHDEVGELLASAGAQGADIPVRPGGHVLPENVKTDLPRAVQAAKKNGIAVDMIVTSITRADEQYTEDILRTASELGIRYYRLGYINFDDKLGIWGTLQDYKPELAKLEKLNRKYNLHGAYQNHFGTRVGGPVWDLFELLRDLDPRYIGCQYDVRHATAEGGSSWINGLKLIAPWVKCTALKDFYWSKNNSGKWNPESVPIGNGMVNFEEYFTFIKKAKIDGPASIHLEYPPFERFTAKVTPAEKKKIFIEAMKKDVDSVQAMYTKYQL
ncbi:MAG: TIM barrel protein [Bacteroidales bacterium]